MLRIRIALTMFWLLLACAALLQLFHDDDGPNNLRSAGPLIILWVVVIVAATQLTRSADRIWPIFILLGSSLFLLVVAIWSGVIAMVVNRERGDPSIVPITIFVALGVAGIVSFGSLLVLLRETRRLTLIQ